MLTPIMETSAYKQMYELEDTHWWFLAKRTFISAILPDCKKQWNILDIGSGTGGLTHFLSRWGRVKGVEKSSIAARYLIKRNITFVNKDILNYSASTSSFDLICLFDVLYHRDIHQDKRVLKKVYHWLKPGGYLCVTDSALPILLSHHDVIMKTRERYYLNDLAMKVSKAGFVIQKKSYIYFFIFPIIIIVRLLNKFIPFNTVGKVPSLINTFLIILCQTEARLLTFTSFPIGSSVILLAQKQ